MCCQCSKCSKIFNTSRSIALHSKGRCSSVIRCCACRAPNLIKPFDPEDDWETLAQQTFNFNSCEFCGRSFRTRKALVRHYRDACALEDIPSIESSRSEPEQHLTIRPFRYPPKHDVISSKIPLQAGNFCGQCRRMFVNEHALDQHLRESRVHRTHTETAGKLRKHQRNRAELHDNQHKILVTFCRICDLAFSGVSATDKHLFEYPDHKLLVLLPDFLAGGRNNPQSDWIEFKRINCFLCPSKFRAPSGLAQHMESGCKQLPANRHRISEAIHALGITPSISLHDHSVTEGSSSSILSRVYYPSLVTYYADTSPSDYAGYQCHVCSKIFNGLNSLKSHMNSPAHDRDEFKCPKCERQFKLISGLVQHLESGSCGLSNRDDVEERFLELTARFTHSLEL